MAKVNVVCPNPECRKESGVDEVHLGKSATCPGCGKAFILVRNPWAKGEVILDDFLIEGKLGEGGMGAVYLVRSKSGGQRFAVKRTLFRDEASQRNFLTELQTWIDLPEHPHLTACRFFRTVGDEVAVFAEYVDGGSLESAIVNRTMTGLEGVLDALIQFAWGLNAAHELGLVHLDVKPGNALLTAQGVLKVTDFGLMKARAAGGVMSQKIGAGHSVYVPNGGLMTKEYASPEQAEGKPLSRKTDMYSWGVSALEMFTGGLTWRSGSAAPESLEVYLESGPDDPRLPRMPAGVVEVLRRCFREDPGERWATMDEVAERLRQVYWQEARRDYPRQSPGLMARGTGTPIPPIRHRTGGYRWTDPREWLIKVLKEDGRDLIEAEKFLPGCCGTQKAQAIADLAAYEVVRRIYVRLIVNGRRELETELAKLCMEKAFIHAIADDRPGAVALYEQCIEIRKRLVNEENRRELAGDLVRAYINKAESLNVIGDHGAAVAIYDQVIPILERLVTEESRCDLAQELAWAYTNKAVTLYMIGDYGAAAALYDQAIPIFERLVNREGRHHLACAYKNKAKAVSALGDLHTAVVLYDQAISTMESLVNQEGDHELANDLADAYMCKGATVDELGNLRAAVALHDLAIANYERLVNREGLRELENDLAHAFMFKAGALSSLGEKRAAVALFEQAIAIRKRLVNLEGRRELEKDLAEAYMRKANELRDLGDNEAAMPLFEQCIAIRERLVNLERRNELASDLAWAYTNKALSASNLGDYQAAVALNERSVAIFERLVNQESRGELANDLALVGRQSSIDG